jgi:hypothetical protein
VTALRRTGLAFAVLLCAAAPVFGEDEAAVAEPGAGELLLERAEITGNRELPKVLYIVPWQKSDPGALAGKPVNTLLDEVLAPLDREEFIREVDYYSDLHGFTSADEVSSADEVASGDEIESGEEE